MNNAKGVLLDSGKYLVREETAEDDLALLSTILYEKIKTIMRIISIKNKEKYRRIEKIVAENIPSGIKDKYTNVDELIAEVFAWLLLKDDGLIFVDEIPEEEAELLDAMEPVIRENRHECFSEEFWDNSARDRKIKEAQEKGMKLYKKGHAGNAQHDSVIGVGSDPSMTASMGAGSPGYYECLDRLVAMLKKDATYLIKYDASRLSGSQIGIIREYTALLDKRSSAEVKTRPFSSAKGSRETLLAVYCAGREFKGEGHVDLAIPPEERLDEYALKMNELLDVALAASSIPDEILADGTGENFSMFFEFISSQYEKIIGKNLILPGKIEEKLRAVKNIVLELPETLKEPYGKIDKQKIKKNDELTSA